MKYGICVSICPVKPKALNISKNKIPEYNYNHCIKCYCCQELCPEGAIKLKKSILRNVINFFLN